jgi:hypothetical protein
METSKSLFQLSLIFLSMNTIFSKTKINDLLILPVNSTKCAMLAKTCKIPLLIQNGIDIANLTYNQSTEEYFHIIRIEQCIENCNSSNATLNYTLNYILLNSIIVGKGSFSLKFKDDNSIIEHQVIVTSPERIVDKIHQAYIIIFQTVISVFMGLLIDMNTILKIIKIPTPVLIGVSLQYLGMPLVSLK